MTELKHTHYSPYGPPRQVPGTLLDCTPEYESYHRLDGSELFADYMYSPRFGEVSATGLPTLLYDALVRAYMHHRAPETQWCIADVTADPEYTYRVRFTNRTAYNGDGPDWHSEEWGLTGDDAQWRRIVTNPHPPYEHLPAFCPNCDY